MKKKFKKLATFLVILFVLMLIPEALNIQSELNMRTIISAVAVDVVEDDFLVTLQVVKPSSSVEGGGTELDFISASASTVATAMDEASIALGRTSGLAHIGTIILGKKIIEQDLTLKVLDYFLREKGIQNSAMLLVSEKTAKETLENTKKLQLSSAVGLPKVFLYKQNNTNGVMMQLQNFLNDNLATSGSSVISGVEILSKEEAEKQEGDQTENSGTSASASGSSIGSGEGGAGGKGSSEKDGRIKYSNDIYIFKKGQYKLTLSDADAIRGVYFINRNSREGVVAVDNISNDLVSDAKVAVYFRDKRVLVKSDWSGDKPRCVFTIKTDRNEVYSIESKGLNGELYQTDKLYLTPDIISAVQEKIKSDTMLAFEICKDAGVDIFQCGNRLHQKNAKKWWEFYNEFGEDYIKNIDIEVKLQMKT